MIKVTSLSHVFSIIHGKVIALPVDGMTKPLMMCEEGWQEIECQPLGDISHLPRMKISLDGNKEDR